MLTHVSPRHRDHAMRRRLTHLEKAMANTLAALDPSPGSPRRVDDPPPSQ